MRPVSQSELDVISETASRLFEKLFPSSQVSKTHDCTFLPEDWSRLEALGLPNALIPEDMGGAGLDPAEALALVRTAGAHALPLPFAETMMARWFLAHAGFDIPEGPVTVAAASSQEIALKRAGEGWSLEGRIPRVPWGARSNTLAVILKDGGQHLLAHVQRSQFRAEQGANLAREPRDGLHLSAVLESSSVRRLPSHCGQDALRLLGAAMRSCAIAGALEKVLALTVQYAREREQFGRPIGKFQAIQQNLAVLAGEAAAASAAAQLAAEAVSNKMEPLAIAAAKIRAGEAAGAGAAIAHQIFGAIGFTIEHQLHLYTQRLWSWREEYGSESEWSAVLGRRAIAAGADGLWPLVTSI
jgi:acyl-CoA dehydrogenase